MNLVVNGKKIDTADGLTVSKLLVRENVKMPEMVSVELNGKILKRSEFDTTQLNNDDQVEFLYYMGGGSVSN